MSLVGERAIVPALTSVPPGGGGIPMDMPPPAAGVTIAGQDGGTIRAHVARVLDRDRAGSHRRVTGDCVSACAFFLTLPPDRIRVGPGARFASNQSTEGSGTMAITDTGQAITGVHPPVVQRWLRAAPAACPPACRR